MMECTFVQCFFRSAFLDLKNYCICEDMCQPLACAGRLGMQIHPGAGLLTCRFYSPSKAEDRSKSNIRCSASLSL